jgi:hypothetical protein
MNIVELGVNEGYTPEGFCPICSQSSEDSDVPPKEWAIRHTMDTGHYTICGATYHLLNDHPKSILSGERQI